MNKVSIYTMYFLPDFGSAPILMNEMAGYLARAGRCVEVVTTVPRRRPAEFRYTFYSVSDGGGFIVKRFRTNATPNPLGRLAAWNIYTAGAFFEMLKTGKRDVLFLRTPPLQLGIPARLAGLLRGSKILLNVQDIHPDLAIEAGILKNRLGIALAGGPGKIRVPNGREDRGHKRRFQGQPGGQGRSAGEDRGHSQLGGH